MVEDQKKTERERTGLEIAVIGMAARFPKSEDVDKFWENLKNGVECIDFFSYEELEAEGIPEELLNNPNYVRARGILNDVESFDASFFDYTPAEAELMDPQIRLFYECVWWALENAGYSPDIFRGRIGVVAGATNNRHWEGRALLSGKTLVMGSFASDHLIDRDFLSTRIAYRLNLTGPAIAIKTACSTSLVAVDMACRLLLTGQCDIALAGGTSSPVLNKIGYLYREGMVSSPDGHCRAFDARSKGVIFSDGLGVVVLKQLDDAVADGDNILAVILGSAINNDGSHKGSYSAPSAEGQAEVIRAALQIAEVEPETISYVETHGTGTTLGDPVEIEGLNLAFDTNKRGYCALGSVKSNVGHLDTTAGIASFIKAVLAVYHKCIPPSLHFEKPNPKIDFENSPFYVNTRLQEWPADNHPRRAGVSSFGVGGTNAHVILEEAAERGHSCESRKKQLILLSAKSEKAVDQMTDNFREYLKRKPGLNLADAAYTLQVGRSPFKLRQMLLASTIDEVVVCLTPPKDDSGVPFDREKVLRDVALKGTRPVYMFSGQGSQYVNMGLDLYTEEPDFAEEMDRCFEIFKSLMGYSIKDIIYPGSSASSDPERINQTEIAQPVIFMIEYALARLLMKWGITPHAMIGHSIGEYTAACLAGVLTLADAVKLVAVRGKLMQRMPTGSMLSVPLSEEKIVPYLDDELELAAVNAPSLAVVSGPTDAINRLAEKLQEKGHQVRLLHTSHAFHSRSMDAMLEEFEREVGRVTLNKPAIPYISNLTGTWIRADEAADPGYWARHLRRTVRFADGLTELLKDELALLVEVGPGKSLSTFARQHPDKKSEQMIINLVRHPKEDRSDSDFLLNKIGRMWLHGQTIDWQAFYSREKRRRVPLPLYPFQRQPYWIPREVYDTLGTGTRGGASSLNKRKDFDDWFYIPSWKRSVLPTSGIEENTESWNWLFFKDECGIGSQLIQQLQQIGHHVVTVTAHSGFSRLEAGSYTVASDREEDYVTLFKTLDQEDKRPHRIVHLWNVTAVDSHRWGSNWTEHYLDIGFYSLLYLAKAIGKQNISDEIRLTVFTNRVQAAIGNEELYPEKALVLGPVNVIPQEFPNIVPAAVDIILPGTGSLEEGRLVQQLMEEITSNSTDTVIAYRSHYRLVQTYAIASLGRAKDKIPHLKEKGFYLITGGLGGIGLVLAQYLAERVKPRLMLTGRSNFPSREDWDRWLQFHPLDNPLSMKIRKIKELETLGAEVLVVSVDVADFKGMKKALAWAQGQWGPINGVIHAAGLPGGGMIQLKTREMADTVIIPKMRGTLVLDTLLRNTPLDFIVLCSSISSVVPDLGQVDYFAANAFLDAYAFYKNTVDGIFTVSVNWDAWQEVGMAVEAAKGSSLEHAAVEEPQPLEIPHPLFEKYISLGEARRKYITHLSLEKHWLLNEHMTTEGKGLLPGTTYLELTRAAWESYVNNLPLEISEVSFIIPMMVAQNEDREVYLSLEKEDDHFLFTVESTIPGEVNFLQRHALGKIRALQGQEQEPPAYDLEDIEFRCNARKAELSAQTDKKENPGSLIVFGPRWKISRWKKYGQTEGLIMLELPSYCAGEVEQYKLHPSLLDISTAFMVGHISERKAYIPFAYKRLRMYRPLPSRVLSYCRLAEDGSTQKELLKFNVTIMDEHGKVCVDIQEFTMLKLSEGIKTRIREKEHVSSPNPSSLLSSASQSQPGKLNERQRFLRKFGIRPSEGVEVFKRVLSVRAPQVVINTSDLFTRLEMRERLAVNRIKESQGGGQAAGTKHSRPEISSAYVAPSTELEKMIAKVFQEQLGIDSVGINDDFFELGGDSLKAVSFVSRIHKETDTEVPLSEFFNRANIKSLARYMEEKKGRSRFYAICPAELKEYYTLSSAQKRLYVLQRLEPTSTGYNLPIMFMLEGSLDQQELKKTLATLIQRHESFRTSFELLEGEPVQRIHEVQDLVIEYYDVEHLVPAAEAREARPMSEEILRNFIRPFDLSCAPLIRVGLIRIDKERHILMADVHHIIHDGTSQLVLLKEFAALAAGQNLPELKIQYKDFSEWQKRLIEVGTLKRQEEYWLKEFIGEVPVLNLPTDFVRPAVQSFAGDSLNFEINRIETGWLKEFTLGEGGTLYMILLALFNILFSKLSGQEEIVIGTPIAGRRHADLELVIGVFVNTLALRNYPTEEKTFKEFLVEVKGRTLEVFENQEYQFEDLVERVAVNRDAGRNPLFDVMFTFQSFGLGSSNIPEEGRQRSDLRVINYDFERKAAKFDMEITAWEIRDRLVFRVEYCTKLFKKETIERFIGNFKRILISIMEEPERKISAIEIISPEEKAQILEDFNNTHAGYPKDKTIHQIFTEQVEKTPDRIALIGRVQSTRDIRQSLEESLALCTMLHTITYQELNNKTERLANLLRRTGIQENFIVGLLLERSVEMMIGLFAVLKAGGAYLPILPAYPEKRIWYMLADSTARLLLTTHDLAEKFENLRGLEVETIFIEDLDNAQVLALNKGQPTTSLAYVIYTSGSTGNPKGVIIEHGSVVNRINWMQRFYPIGQDDVILQKTPYIFDVSVWELFWWSFQGACLCLLGIDEEKNPAAIIETVEKSRVTTMHFVPSMLKAFLEYCQKAVDPGRLSSLKQVFASGEVLGVHEAERFDELISQPVGAKLYNLYGPTEATVDVSYYNCIPGEEIDRIPIGKPIDNTALFIVDRGLNLQPFRVNGELCIAGVGLARGYLNRPELTTERFIKNPYMPAYTNHQSPNTNDHLMYRTGDLARWFPDGNIEFLGRMDYQVKIRGFRIELEEIENQISNHEKVKEVLVISRNNADGTPYLCAYIVGTGPVKEISNTSAFREYLSQILPEYMIPSYFVPLEKMPLTPSGKIDRKVLPEPGDSRPELAVTYVKPNTKMEKIIADIWQEVLKLDRIGVNDSFFDLGGNSLDVIKVSSRLKDVVAREIPLISMFRYRTIGSFANYLIQEEEDNILYKDRSEVLEKGERIKSRRLQVRKGNRK